MAGASQDIRLTMIPRRTIAVFLISFLAAVTALRWWQAAEYPRLLWEALGIIGIVSLAGCAWRRMRLPALHTFAATLGIAIAFVSVMRTTHVSTPADIDFHADGKEAAVIGRIIKIDPRETSIKYTLDASAVQRGDETKNVRGKVLVTDRSLWPRLRYGDEVRVRGPLEKPEEFEGFHYDEYLSAFRTYAIMRTREIVILKPAEGFTIRGWLLDMRGAMSLRIGMLLPEPHAALMDGLLTGNRASVPDSVLQNFTTAGLTHMLAISGYNISIVISVLSSMLFFLPVRWRLIPSIVAVTLFTLFVGSSAAVTRAALMGILGLLALHYGRLRDVRLAVLWTAFFMLAPNPRTLWFDPGFQLSFLSVMGLIELQPFLVKILKHVPETLGLREGLALTIAAQIFAAPWTALLFGKISLISPLANVLAAPLIPFAMLTGALGIGISLISMPLGQLTTLPAWGLIEGMLRVAAGTSAVPFASVAVPPLAWWLIVLYYAALGGLLITLRPRTEPQAIGTH